MRMRILFGAGWQLVLLLFLRLTVFMLDVFMVMAHIVVLDGMVAVVVDGLSRVDFVN